MDVVIPVREVNHSDHLRFALRSIADHFDSLTVILVGGRPEWVSRTAIHLSTVQDGNKFENQAKAMRLACETDSISDPFVWWCDDHYLMQPATVPRVARADWARARDVYQRRMTETREMLDGFGLPTLNYELHLPMVIQKHPMLTALGMGGDMRTVYGNLIGYATDEISDVKLKGTSEPWPHGPWVSTTRATFRQHRAHLEQAFPTPSIYEAR